MKTNASDNKLQPDTWVDQYADLLLRYVLMRINNKNIAEDLVQETFLKAWKARETYEGKASEKNWLFAICKNKIIDHYRKSATDPLEGAEEELIYFDATGHWKRNETTPKQWLVDYKSITEEKDFFNAYDLCKQKLKTIQQKVFSMKYEHDLKASEICEVLNISDKNYWVIIHRCKLHLRSCLEKNLKNI